MDGNVWKRKVNLFLLGIPLVIFADRIGLRDDLVLALLGGLALIPLAGFVESGVEELAELLGPFLGGLLHTTFSNIAEVLIALSVLLTFPVGRGAEVVLGSIAGVIIRNSLLFLGLGTFLGCLKNGKMRFDSERAGEYTTVFALAVIGLSLPTLAFYIKQSGGAENLCASGANELELFCRVPLSTALAIVLLVSYLAYVAFAVFRFRDRQRQQPQGSRLPAALGPALALAEQPDTQALFSAEREQAEEELEELDAYLHPKLQRSRALRQARKTARAQRAQRARTVQGAPEYAHTRTVHDAPHARSERSTQGEGEGEESFFERSKTLRGSLAVIILAIAIAGVFLMSEAFAHGAEALIAANKSLGDDEFFFGLIVIPVVGGLVELYGTAGSARANRMELVMATTAGATIQMVLLMVPVLVIVGALASRPLDLVFKPVEVIVFGATTFVFMLLSRDGESTILEGVQLVALWTLLAVTALFLPPG